MSTLFDTVLTMNLEEMALIKEIDFEEMEQYS